MTPVCYKVSWVIISGNISAVTPVWSKVCAVTLVWYKVSGRQKSVENISAVKPVSYKVSGG